MRGPRPRLQTSRATSVIFWGPCPVVRDDHGGAVVDVPDPARAGRRSLPSRHSPGSRTLAGHVGRLSGRQCRLPRTYSQLSSMHRGRHRLFEAFGCKSFGRSRHRSVDALRERPLSPALTSAAASSSVKVLGGAVIRSENGRGQQWVETRSRRTSGVWQSNSTGRFRATSSADWLAGPDPLQSVVPSHSCHSQVQDLASGGHAEATARATATKRGADAVRKTLFVLLPWAVDQRG